VTSVDKEARKVRQAFKGLLSWLYPLVIETMLKALKTMITGQPG
jgi:hypothetical protein